MLRKLLESCPLPLTMSVSATTREPREGEQDGVQYHFLSHEEFVRRREAGEFLEWKEVYGRGALYGTLRSAVTAGLNAGKWVILEIDVEGAMMVLEHHSAVTIFLHPGSLTELELRLRRRGTESEDSIRRRLEVAEEEMKLLSKYDHEVINETVPQAADAICRLLTELP